jgi:hypothetical protein
MKNINSKKMVETINNTPFGKCKVSQLLPVLKLIAFQFELSLNTPDGMRKAIKICANCINKN